MHLLASDSSKREQPKRKQTGNLRSPLATDGGLTQRKAARPTLGGEPQRRNLGNTQNHLWSGSTKAKTPTFTPQPKCCRSLVDRAWTCVDVHAPTGVGRRFSSAPPFQGSRDQRGGRELNPSAGCEMGSSFQQELHLPQVHEAEVFLRRFVVHVGERESFQSNVASLCWSGTTRRQREEPG